MTADNDLDYDDEDESAEQPGSPDDGGTGEGAPPSGAKGFRDWLSGKRGWVMLFAVTVIQGLFATIMIMLRSDARPVRETEMQRIQALAVEMLGHEVAIKQIYQVLPAGGGKRMTIGLDIVLVLGQLPEERVEGAPRPNAEELEMFMAAIRDMEPRIRSQVNLLLQKVPAREYGSVDVPKMIKEEVKEYINDSLDRLDFGKKLRPGIGKRRVTEVLLPTFVRQVMSR